jgi:ribose transport system permease protein
MADREKKGNAFTNNPIVKAIGTQKIVVVLVIIFLAIMFSVGSPAFRQYSTLVSIFDYSYYISFMAIGVTFCLITGGVDLSIGTGMICYALFGGHLITKVGMPVVVGMLAAIALGVLIGLLNALLVAVMDLPPFIATLGTMMITRGLGSLLTGAMSVTWPPAAAENGWFRSIFKLKMNGKMIPVGFILVLICVILMSIFLNKTRAVTRSYQIPLL